MIEDDRLHRSELFGGERLKLAVIDLRQPLRIIEVLSLLWHLKDEPVRFNDLARMLSGASKRVISERLKHLEGHGLIKREILETSPVGVAYHITPRGATALGFLDEIRKWSEAQVTDGFDANEVEDDATFLAG